MLSTAFSRRDFLKGLAAGGVLLGLSALGCKSEPERTEATTAPAFTGAKPDEPHTWLAIAPSGAVSIVVARSEMGQGARTTMALAIADELGADRDRVSIVQAVGDEAKYGSQNTDGSTSIRDHLKTARQAGAAAREMLRQAAADRWQLPVAEITVKDHQVRHEKSGKAAGLGDLAEAAGKLAAPKDPPLKDHAQFTYMGTEAMKGFDQADIVAGKAVFGADVRLPGMKYAAVRRPPVYGGKTKSYDDKAARAVPGVEAVVKLPDVALPAGFSPLGGVAVVATNTWAAIKGRDALEVTWDDGPNRSYDSAAYRQALEAAVNKPGTVVKHQGDVKKAAGAARQVVKASYYLPHLAHAPMEPPAAIANVTDGRCEVWAPTQNPQGARDELAKALGLDAKDVTVHVTLLGGGFGRKSKPDFILEAALLSKAVKAPVRVQWTREDEIKHGFYHTVSAQHLEASLDAAGKVTGWLHRTAFPSIGTLAAKGVDHGLPFELGMGVADLPFAVPNLQLEVGDAAPHVRIGWFRSVANIYHAYAVQTFVHQLAQAAGKDHRAFLLDLIGPARQFDLKDWNYGRQPGEHPVDTARLRKVIETACEKAGWGKTLPKGQALGLAAHRSFLSYVATVVHVEVRPDGSIAIPRVDTAIDCGFAVNPDRVRSQIEGAAVMGASLAMYGELSFKDGKAVQSNFYDFQVARMNTAPAEVHTHILDTGDALGGVGEPGLPVFAPAFANAIAAATGKRFTTLPIAPQLT